MKISCDALTYRYPGTRDNIFTDFSIEFPTHVTMLRGYSGCGKSTLLRLGAGMLKPSSGAVRMEGIHAAGSREFFRKELSFVFQNLNLLPLASVERNLSISLRIAGIDLGQAQKWLEILGLWDLRGRTVERLSGGQRQRVAIARAIAKRPKVLFLDEPTSGLDDENTRIIKSAVKEFTSERNTICVVATHDQRLEEIADELVDFHTFVSLEK